MTPSNPEAIGYRTSITSMPDWACPGMYDLADTFHLRRLAELDLTTILTTTGPTWSGIWQHVSADSNLQKTYKYDTSRY